MTSAYTSRHAVIHNPGVMLRWATIIAILTFAAMAAGFISLLFCMPLIWHASWYAYRETVAQH